MTVDDDWDTADPEPPKLNVRCTDSDCDNDLHCFKRTQRMIADEAPRGECRECHEQLVELDRTRERRPGDGEYLRYALEKELIRHHFWHLPVDEKAVAHATRKGRIALYEAVPRRLRSSVGKANPFRDGTQTPMTGNSIYYAQHATAACCRTCIEYWHGIEKGRELNDEEIDYLTELVVSFLDERLPDLEDEGKRVPRVSNPDS
jgi:hypothetical protein